MDLPWADKRLAGAFLDKMEHAYRNSEEIRSKVEGLARELEACIFQLGLEFRCDANPLKEWSFKDHLKSIGYGVCYDESVTYFENVIRFLELVNESSFQGVVTFSGLRYFLTDSELKTVRKQAFYLDVTLLDLYCSSTNATTSSIEEIRVDQDFLSI